MSNVLLAEAKHDSAPDETGTENVNYTASHWSTNAPKLVFHLGTQCNLTQITSDADLSFGFGNASEEANMSYFNEDGQSTTDTQYGIQNADVVTHLNDSAAVPADAVTTLLNGGTTGLFKIAETPLLEFQSGFTCADGIVGLFVKSV